MNKKKILRVISLVVVFCFTLTFAVFAAPKDKLPYGQEKKLARYRFDYNISANFMKEKGIIKGYGNGDFGFDDYVKRGDITVMIVRAFNINTIINRYVENFDDVEYGSYYYDAIVAARSFGIAKGNGKSFNPKKYVTIREAIMLIERSAAVANSNITVEDVDLEDLYDDSELDEYATRSDIANMIYYVLTGDEYNGEEVEDINIDTIEYTIKENTVLTFDGDKLMNEFEDATDEEFDYVKFTLPSTSYGRLYYDYTSATNYDSLVSATTKYYADANPNISDVTFVPKTNYSGTVSIKYTAYDENRDSYSGIIDIIIKDNVEDLDTIKYTIEENTKKTFDEDDIVEAFEDATKGEEFDYVKFTLPSTSYGKLYYDYTSATNYDSLVKATTKYYDDANPNISDVTFVPKTNYSGTVSIKYTAYDEDGDSYSGIIKIIVKGNDYSIDTIKYTIEENTKKTFDEDDIVEAFEDATDGEEFNYVKFTIPSTSYGKLYYDYTSATNYDSLVSATTKYYADTNPNISDVTFVPKTNYYGTVSIKYTAYDEDGDSYSGIINIIVEKNNSSLDTIEYETDENTSFTFDAEDFVDVLKDETDNDLNYVKFILPSRNEGKLYYDYSETSNYKSLVAESVKYFVDSSKYISKVTFVPYTDFYGTLDIDYIAYDEDGISYEGTIEITVNED